MIKKKKKMKKIKQPQRMENVIDVKSFSSRYIDVNVNVCEC